ncbi:hypothetical protein ASG17_07590 [Brevundimonas sp. Leaf363]|uniref:hypothetical protein n=1 Tax=Brevundimonas sp. Leaf363 TaxID=1736353 RepID=UPI0007012A51|nr:hypothetical protein [Brevundimonas sp. Leaf363]KQS55904.1 hypothetical protein ASG17_07590 [Brevundimonas sp. Leaf363]
MPTSRSQAKLYEELADRYGRRVADAFLRALQALRSLAEVQRVTAAVEAGDIEAALDALHIDPEAFNEVASELRAAHEEGGRTAAENMPRRRPDGTALVIRFDGRNLEAEAWLSQHSSDLITRLTQEQRQVVRTSLSEAMQRGVNPRQAALDIVGRVNRVTGRREGGVLGLTMAQEAYVRAARDQLASSDPAALRAYLTRGRRDKRFDRSVTKAIWEGSVVDPAIAAKALKAYEVRLLKLRGETIGRVEAMTALQLSKYEAYRQAIASGKVAENTVTKVWRSAGDSRVRHTHRGLNRESVPFSGAFTSPSGARLRFPMDTALGAGPEETVNCRCDAEYRIDFFVNLR